MLQQAIQAFQSGNFDRADSILKRVLEVDSKNLSVLHILGLIKASQSRYKEATDYLSKAARIDPNDPSLQYNLAKALSDSGSDIEALTHHKKAVELAPNNPEAWLNYGKTVFNLGWHDEAIAHYDQALALKPDYAEGWSNKGITLHELKCFDEAIAHYDKALSLKPNIDWVSGDLLHTKMKICSWSNLSGDLEGIAKRVLANEKVSTPFALLALNDDALLHKRSAEIYAQTKYPFKPALGPISRRPKNKKIRMGYFSADFRNHPVSFLTAELFELHDKNRFEITAFSFGADDKSLIRLRLSQAFNQFIDVRQKSDKEIAQLARELEIDIAVDLGGHTKDSRTGIFSYRAAPIQASYIGYLGTMGVEYYDYLLADEIIIPKDSQQFYSEKITYLASYQSNDRKRIISNRVFTRQELGLPEKGFVFCCFNNNYKILPATFDGWMRILKAVESSVLFLYSENKWAEENLKKEAKARGIDSSRLVFGRQIPMEEYLARYRVCNLFLDTIPYNAGTTASDALWTGLPVLTLIGQSFASRVAASLLKAIGLPELITNSQEEYEALAIELAISPKKLAEIKLKLANNRMTTPLFDTPLFTKNLEAAYIKMYERYLEDLSSETINL